MYFYWKIILVNTIFVNNTFFLIFLKYKPIYLLCMYLVTRAGAAMLQLCYLVVQWAAQLQLKLLCYFILREDELQHVSCHLVIPVLFFSWNKYSLVDHMLSPASLMSFFLFFKIYVLSGSFCNQNSDLNACGAKHILLFEDQLYTFSIGSTCVSFICFFIHLYLLFPL